MFKLSKKYHSSMSVMSITNPKMTKCFKQMTSEFPDEMLSDLKRKNGNNTAFTDNKKWTYNEDGGKLHITCNDKNPTFVRNNSNYDYDITLVSITKKDITSIGITKKGCYDMLYVGSITLPVDDDHSKSSASFFKNIDTKKYDLYLFKNGVDDYRIMTDPGLEKYVANYKIDISKILPQEDAQLGEEDSI